MNNGKIIGFLGKGGSGKSTMSTLLTKYLLETGNKVLAIDADHNMDFSFNMEVKENIPYFGKSINHIKDFIGLEKDENYRTAFSITLKNRFNIFPNDLYTNEYVVKKSANLQVAVSKSIF